MEGEPITKESLRQLLDVAQSLREKSRLAAKAGREDLAEAYGQKAQKLEQTVRNAASLMKAGV